MFFSVVRLFIFSELYEQEAKAANLCQLPNGMPKIRYTIELLLLWFHKTYAAVRREQDMYTILEYGYLKHKP